MSKQTYFLAVLSFGLLCFCAVLSPITAKAQVPSSGAMEVVPVNEALIPLPSFVGYSVSIDDMATTTSARAYVGGLEDGPHTFTFNVPVGYKGQFAFCSYPIGGTECVVTGPISFFNTGYDCVDVSDPDCIVRRVELFARSGMVTKITLRYFILGGSWKVIVKGNGSGSIMRKGANFFATTTDGYEITCKLKDCRGSAVPGVPFTLRAVPDENSIFAGWSEGNITCTGVGDCTGSVPNIFSSSTTTATFTLKPTTTPTGASSVLFIPGLMGSRLYDASTTDKVWEKFHAGSDLYLDVNGNSIKNLYTQDILDEVIFAGVPTVNIYKSFAQFMNGMVTGKTIAEWRPFPYDWRMDLPTITSLSPAPQLTSLSCSPSRSSATTVQLVNWLAQVNPTNPYTYVWSGSFIATTTASSTSLTTFATVGVKNEHLKVYVGTKLAGEVDCTPLTVKLPPTFESIGKVISLSIQDKDFDLAGAQLKDVTVYLDTFILALAEHSYTNKVTIVAHSYGGLVAKALIKRLQDEGRTDVLNKIDRVILVSVPQLGTPQALVTLLHGQSIGKFSVAMTQETNRRLAENAPAAYNFIPSPKYFSKVTDPVIVFDKSASSTLGKFYGANISDYQTLKSFLLAEKDGRPKPSSNNLIFPNKLNNFLFPNAETNHNNLDSWEPPSNIKVIEVAGWGVDTIKSVEYAKIGGKLVERFPRSVDGDGTVVIPSAISKAGFYIIDLKAFNDTSFINLGHKDIFEASSTQALIKYVILDSTGALPSYATTTLPVNPGIKRLHFSMFSPAEVHVYDRLGNHTGVVDTQNEIFEEKIPNSYYFEVGESKYLGVDVEDVSRVELKGTGLGTFTLEIEQVVGTTSTTTTYADVPVSPSMKGVIDVTKSTPQLNLDIEGDGKADFIVGPAVHLDPLIYAQMLQKIVKGMKLYSSVEDSILDKLKDILSEIKDKDFDDAREVRNEVRRILLNLEWKEGKITQVQRKSLLLLFNVFNIGKDDNIASVIYVEQWVTDIKSRNLEDGVEGSILAKIDDVYDELVEEDNKEAKEDLEKLIKNLLDQSWKSGKIAQDQRDLLISNAVELQASLKSIQS